MGIYPQKLQIQIHTQKNLIEQIKKEINLKTRILNKIESALFKQQKCYEFYFFKKSINLFNSISEENFQRVIQIDQLITNILIAMYQVVLNQIHKAIFYLFKKRTYLNIYFILIIIIKQYLYLKLLIINQKFQKQIMQLFNSYIIIMQYIYLQKIFKQFNKDISLTIIFLIILEHSQNKYFVNNLKILSLKKYLSKTFSIL
ncbi:transmembrane protein, putative (macronuclear) [Tetrahymena thermophila SB210]|uniref:Transmembrane protein, putative n=1 Tax=Tetrahymena thermophila (strain SB210) TaxID=312017 RepID=W7X9F5_TETTS|nr:transmembrane protein, putative [Tetrahymena thermophila SB210]EWS73028.1 transmembrane protein, putative [Tetrahymena thermophila SB210]|eukprot:XP_012654425.1 transmembrane protein, putative [Tetrahymena thermophila SB210]